MRRERAPARRWLLAFSAAAGCGACAGEAAMPARYSLDQCRRIDVVDAQNGAAVVGAEDLALDARRGRLFISAYDRKKAEAAARRKAFAIPEGGVYSVQVSALLNDDMTAVHAAPIVNPSDIAGGLRPHGLDYDEGAGEVAFINRGYQRINGKWTMTSSIERAGANGEAFVGARTKAPCAANDLIDDGHEMLISFDHEACNWRSGLEDATGMKRSGVASADGTALFDRAAFANGLARTADGDLVLAATREDALLILVRTADGYDEERRIEVPGGPDNLTRAGDGGVIAALHPSLLRIGLHRRLGVGRAPSRIVKADPADGAVEILFDDPEGKLFSAATVAVEHDGALIAGSVTDAGLLVCKPGTDA